jgi:hypothetical protein
LSEFALGPVARSQRELRAAVAGLEQALNRWSTASQWKQHLQSEALRRLTGGEDLEPAHFEQLRTILQRFDQVASDRQHARVVRLPQFQLTHGRLRQLVGFSEMMAVPIAEVGLDPQPEQPGKSVGLNPQPEPPGSPVGLNPQPEPPGGRPVGLDPQPEQPG